MEPTQSRHKQAAQSTGIVYIATRCTGTVPSIYFGTGTQHVKEKNSLLHTETENGIRHYFRLGRKNVLLSGKYFVSSNIFPLHCLGPFMMKHSSYSRVSSDCTNPDVAVRK